MPDRRPAPYDPVPDIAELMAGLQVVRSLPVAREFFGTALEPYDRLREGLGLFGYPAAWEHIDRLRSVLKTHADEAA